MQWQSFQEGGISSSSVTWHAALLTPRENREAGFQLLYRK